eukprot:350057-Chlamydomonas_euryale.AAC.3
MSLDTSPAMGSIAMWPLGVRVAAASAALPAAPDGCAGDVRLSERDVTPVTRPPSCHDTRE